MAMPLSHLLPQTGSDLLIRAMTLDSRKVRPGDLFLAIPGLHHDGRAHIADAVARGAVAVAYESAGAAVSAVAFPDTVLIPVADLERQLSALAGRFYGEPCRSLRLIGVTGTNGKTSVTHLLAQAMDRLGERCGIIGTLGNGFYGALERSLYTTPDAISVQESLARMKQAGAGTVAMEVSSHGLAQGRVAALDFDVAVFTNLSRDHLDYHGTMQAYGEAKARLFESFGLGCRVINLDDPFGRELARRQQAARLMTYSLERPEATLYCTDIRLDEQGATACLVTPQGSQILRSPLLGRFNLSNLLAVVGALLGMDYPLDEILAILPALQGPAGRLQQLGGGTRPLVVVDYAHTPDALEKVLTALRPHARGRLCCLLGCGGDRDPGKRPLMAAIAERLADQVVVTDDNPRSEDPLQIQAEIRSGFLQPEQVSFVPGRAEAIARLVADGQPGDVLVLAGKGHEDYQEIHGVRRPFSDLDEARQALVAWEVAHA